MCRGSSDPAFNTQLGEKAHQEKKPCCKVGLNREKAAAKAQPAMLACPLIPQVVCLSKAVSYSELPLPQAVFFVECSPCTPNDTTGFNGARNIIRLTYMAWKKVVDKAPFYLETSLDMEVSV